MIHQSIDQAKTSSEANFRSLIEGSLNEIDERTRSAVGQVRQATNLKDWGEIYDQNIRDLIKKLYGNQFEGSFTRNLNTLTGKYKNLGRVGLKNINWWRLFGRCTYLIFKNVLSFIYILFTKLFSVAGRRTGSFLLLAVSGLLVAGLPLAALTTGLDSLSVFLPKDPTQWLSKITIILPIIIIFSLAYSFSTKNYRIYANMLDQYKHRRAVAKTAQGIILSIDPNSGDAKLRDAMTAAAATALFEHKVTGHLSKKEVESLGLLDVARSITK